MTDKDNGICATKCHNSEKTIKMLEHDTKNLKTRERHKTTHIIGFAEGEQIHNPAKYFEKWPSGTKNISIS